MFTLLKMKDLQDVFSQTLWLCSLFVKGWGAGGTGVVHARVEVLDGSERLPISNRGCDQFSVPIHEYFLFLCFGGSCFFLVLSESGGEKPLAVPSPKASGRAVASDNTNG